MKTSPQRSADGFSLVEVTLALGVAAVCLVSLFGLIPVGITSVQQSLEQTAAASVASGVIADLRATPTATTVTPSPRYAIPVPASTSDALTHTLFLCDDGTLGTNSVDADADATKNPRYRVTMTFVPPASGLRNATAVRLLVTWPAISDPKASATPSNFSGSLEAVTALDRH